MKRKLSNEDIFLIKKTIWELKYKIENLSSMINEKEKVIAGFKIDLNKIKLLEHSDDPNVILYSKEVADFEEYQGLSEKVHAEIANLSQAIDNNCPHNLWIKIEEESNDEYWTCFCIACSQNHRARCRADKFENVLVLDSNTDLLELKKYYYEQVWLYEDAFFKAGKQYKEYDPNYVPRLIASEYNSQKVKQK